MLTTVSLARQRSTPSDRRVAISPTRRFAYFGAQLLVRSNLGEGDIIFAAPFFCGGETGAGGLADQTFGFGAPAWFFLDQKPLEEHAQDVAVFNALLITFLCFGFVLWQAAPTLLVTLAEAGQGVPVFFGRCLFPPFPRLPVPIICLGIKQFLLLRAGNFFGFDSLLVSFVLQYPPR